MVKILLVASKKAFTRNLGKVAPPTKDPRLIIVEEIVLMKKLRNILRL